MNIPARLNPATLEPEYLSPEGIWEKVSFSLQANQPSVKGYLHLINGNNLLEPQYYLHFTIAHLQNGTYKTLEFDETSKVSNFPEKMALETGYYALVTGNRQSDGAVLSSVTYFKIAKDSLTQIKVELQHSDSLRVSGHLKLESPSSPENDIPTILVIIDPDKEPSKHILNDLSPYKDTFNKTNARFIFTTSAVKAKGLDVLKTYTLPDRYLAVVDQGDSIYSTVASVYGTDLKDKLPLVLLFDHTGTVYYFSSGYKIGVGEQLLKVIRQMETSGKDRL